jgi:nucleotide-binding universal stress UspA family protein
MIKSILLAVDGSVYTDAVVSQGIDLAKKLDAQLRIFTIVDVRIYEWVLNTGGEGYMPVIPANVFHDESYKFHTERADALLNAIDKRLHDSKINYEIEKLEGSPVEMICDLSRQVDLVIMGARGDYARWGDRMLGQTLESVSRQSHAPIMIVDKVYNPFKTVTCAYDRSEHSNSALKLSGYLADTLQFPIEVVSVFDEEEERKEALEEAQKYLEPYQLNLQLRHEAGDPSVIIVQVTKDAPEPTVLIMGCYGRSRIREAILGSTTVQVMRSAVKPIILAR